MSLIKFKTGADVYNVDLLRVGKNQIKITLQDNISNINNLLSGFYVLNQYNNSIQGNYEDYTCLYYHLADTLEYILSNDNSVYDPENNTDNPVMPTIDEIKSKKVSELSSICNNSIISGVIINEETFSFKSEDQGRIESLALTAYETGISVPWHPDNKSCRLFTPEEIITIYVQQQLNLLHHTTYFNQLKLYVNTLNNEAEINSVIYGQELVGTYLETYDLIMTQGKQIIKAKFPNMLFEEDNPNE